jgi:cell division inhibitor SepF
MALQALKKLKEYIGMGDEFDYADDYSSNVSEFSRSGQDVVNPEVGIKHTMITIHPQSFNDAVTIGESFRNGMTTVVNVTSLTETDARRIIDFMSGLVFSLNGEIERVDMKVFILTPPEIAVVGKNTGTRSDFYNHG